MQKIGSVIVAMTFAGGVLAQEPDAASVDSGFTGKLLSAWEQSAGEWFSPHAHFSGAVGKSSGDPQRLAAGHHDPNREGGTIQGIEIGASLRLPPYIEGFATYNLSYGASKEWEDELEEAFLKLKCPADYGELRGGRMLTRFGQHNTRHLHSWNSVDMPLVLGRFLGDDGLIIDGGDITGYLPLGDTLLFGAVFGYGQRPNFHGGHDHDDDHDHASHAGVANDNIFTGRLFARYTPTDFFEYTLGVSGLSGEYSSDSLDSHVLGADFSVEWRENGFEPGGRRVNWTTEVLYRSFDAPAEMHHDHHGHDDGHDDHHGHHEEARIHDFGESGFYTSLLYSHNPRLDAHLRLGWVEGIAALHQDERTRISPALTWWITEGRTLYTRLQYNYDNIRGDADEHSVWLQFGISLGKAEVR